MSKQLTGDDMPRAAAGFVEAAKDATGLTLDYSPESLQTVDRILESFHTSKDRPNNFQGLLFMCGAYVGEVFRKHHAGEWKRLDELPEEARKVVAGAVASIPVVFQCGSSTLSPYDKVCKRVENGAVDSITHWANVFTKKQFVKVEQLGRPKPGLLGRLFGKS